jgi:ERCC4-type nuclease
MPFLNPFSKKEQKKPKNKVIPVIVADIHEKNSLVLAELEQSKEVQLIIHSLKIGDYLIKNIIIERKTISDFISSMISKRLVEQLRQMKQYSNQLLIVEGNLSSVFSQETNLHPNSIRGFILSILTNYQIPIIFTEDYEETTRYLIILAKQQLKQKTEISLHSRIPKTIKEQKQYVLESFQNIGPIKAKKLLEKFKSLENVFNANEKDLKEILGNSAQSFKDTIENT